MPERFNLDRRHFCGTAAMTIAATQLGLFGCAQSDRAKKSTERDPGMTQVEQVTGSATTAIRPFYTDFPEAELVELRRRITATRWPDRETVTDQSQGVQLATIQELVRYNG
ncbi:MAG: epoxide hydrolase N-terminal domain-containing protein [Vulcanimicrobiaceae bacterium]